MHKSTVSRAVSQLEERGLVRRRPNDRDRREERLELTGEGRRIYEAVAPEALAFERRLAEVLGPGEQAVLAGLLEKLESQARSLAPQSDEVSA
jgi:DNA-binding MarR family transcriptional regulator